MSAKKKNLNKYLNKLGCTKFDIESTEKATKFLINSLVKAMYHHDRIKQTKILLKLDSMSDEDWQMFIEFRWHNFVNEELN